MKDVYKWDVECAQIHKVVKQMEEIRVIRIAGSFSDSSLFFKLTIAFQVYVIFVLSLIHNATSFIHWQYKSRIRTEHMKFFLNSLVFLFVGTYIFETYRTKSIFEKETTLRGRIS